jgi:hypothetical protein
LRRQGPPKRFRKFKNNDSFDSTVDGGRFLPSQERVRMIKLCSGFYGLNCRNFAVGKSNISELESMILLCKV